MPGPTLTPDLFSSLLGLLDDETPEVRASVEKALDDLDGDASELLGARDEALPPEAAETLSELLHPGRRRRLIREWIVPRSGRFGLLDDWDHCESLMRALSDFLHDGITLRQPLGDALDLLADDCEELFHEKGATALVRHLLREAIGPFRTGDSHPSDFDLAAVAAGQPGDDLSRGLVVALVARRLSAPVSALIAPGGLFLVSENVGVETIHTTTRSGSETDRADFDRQLRRAPSEIRRQLESPAPPGEMLFRLTDDLGGVLDRTTGHEEDAALFERLIESLRSPAR